MSLLTEKETEIQRDHMSVVSVTAYNKGGISTRVLRHQLKASLETGFKLLSPAMWLGGSSSVGNTGDQEPQL